MYIEFHVQGMERYGDRWKYKSGGDHLLPIDKDALLAAEDRAAFLADLAERATALLNQDGEMWRQWVVDWELVEADHYTEFELNQLQYEGHIKYWAHIVELPAAA